MADDGRREPLAELALRQMRGTVVPVEDEASVAERRPRLVAALEREIPRVPVERARRERWRRGIYAVVGVAAAFGLLWGGIQWGSAREKGDLASATPLGGAQLRGWAGDVRVGPPGREHAPAAEESLTASSLLTTRESGWVELELPGSVRVEVDGRTELQLIEAHAESRHLRLARGRVDIDVPKPTSGSVQRVIVSTPDAEVRVRGTIFRVEVRPSLRDPERLVTDVTVTRGEVGVHHGGKEHVVSAGSRWSSETPPPATADPAAAGSTTGEGAASERLAEGSPVQGNEPNAAPNTREASTREASTGDARPSPSTPSEGKKDPRVASDKAQRSASTSSLAEENGLFLQALAARDRGAFDETVRLCDEFLRRFPTSTHAESVRLERRRALERLGVDAR